MLHLLFSGHLKIFGRLLLQEPAAARPSRSSLNVAGDRASSARLPDCRVPPAQMTEGESVLFDVIVRDKDGTDRKVSPSTPLAGFVNTPDHRMMVQACCPVHATERGPSVLLPGPLSLQRPCTTKTPSGFTFCGCRLGRSASRTVLSGRSQRAATGACSSLTRCPDRAVRPANARQGTELHLPPAVQDVDKMPEGSQQMRRCDAGVNGCLQGAGRLRRTRRGRRGLPKHPADGINGLNLCATSNCGSTPAVRRNTSVTDILRSQLQVPGPRLCRCVGQLWLPSAAIW